MDGLHDRFLNVSLLPGSRAHLAYYARMHSSLPGDIPVRRPGPGSPSSSPRSSWPTARAPSRSS